jgi:hypothetical protein
MQPGCSAQALGTQAAGSSGVQSLASSTGSLTTAGQTPPPQGRSVLDQPSPSAGQKASGGDGPAKDSGGGDSGGFNVRQQLYTPQLLQKAITYPARVARYLNMPKHERLQYWSEVGARLRPSRAPCPASGFFELTLTYCGDIVAKVCHPCWVRYAVICMHPLC